MLLEEPLLGMRTNFRQSLRTCSSGNTLSASKKALGMLAERNRIRLLCELANRFASLGKSWGIVRHVPFFGIARYWAKSIIKQWVTEKHSRW